MTSSINPATSVSMTVSVGTTSVTWTVTTFDPLTNPLTVSCTPALNNGTPPPRQGEQVTCSAEVAYGIAPPHEFRFMLYSGKTGWGDLQPYGPNSVLNWTPLGMGMHQLVVWVRSVGSQEPYQAYWSTNPFWVQAPGAWNTLGQGQGLYPGQEVWSANLEYVLRQTEGELVLFDRFGQRLWSSNTTIQAGVTRLELDGRLVLYGVNGEEAWSRGSGGQTWALLHVTNDGHLVLYGDGWQVLWQS